MNLLPFDKLTPYRPRVFVPEKIDLGDWPQIAALYRAMLREHPGAVLELNAAVAVAMAEGLETGLAWIVRLAEKYNYGFTVVTLVIAQQLH